MDTNILVAALQSQQGASFRLLSLVGQKRFDICLSVALLLEYEDVTTRLLDKTGLSQTELDDILDYLCLVGHHQKVHFLWRPFLKDPKDDMVLELAVAAHCTMIVSFNQRDFKGSDQFGIQVLKPGEFLKQLGEQK